MAKYSQDKALIFDLDDTLVMTDAKIKVCDRKSGKCWTLTPEEYNSYEKKRDHVLSFDEFKSLEIMKAGKLIDRYFKLLTRHYRKGSTIGIITARDDREMIYTWFKEHLQVQIKKEFIWAINDPVHGLKGNIAQRKKEAFQWFIDHGYTDLSFFDDDKANIKIIDQIKKDYPALKIKTHLVKK